MNKYFLVKETNFYIVRADNEDQALRDFKCQLHSVYQHGNSFVYFGDPVEATDAWSASRIFEEKTNLVKR